MLAQKIDMSLPTSTPGPKRLPEPRPEDFLNCDLQVFLNCVLQDILYCYQQVILNCVLQDIQYCYQQDIRNCDQQDILLSMPDKYTKELSLSAPNVNINENAVYVLRRVSYQLGTISNTAVDVIHDRTSTGYDSDIIMRPVEASAGRNMSQSGVEMDFVMLYKSKLRAVVNQVWLAETELLNGNNSLDRKVAKLSTLKDSLASFSEVVEKVHAFYSAKSLGHLPEVGLPPLEEIERLQFAICTLNNTLTLNQIPALISVHCADRLRPTEDDIVCAILGLSPWVSESLSDLDPGMRDHQPILYYIKKIVDVLATERGTDDTADDKAYVLKSLQCFGFTLNTAALIYRNIPIDILNTQTPAFWAKRYLDHTYNYNPLLNTCPRYPYSGDIVGSWFTCDIRQGPGHETDKHGTINMMNVSEDCKKKINVEAEVAKLISAGDDHKVLYHGTDHKSALKIISEGIILQNGGKCQDFSHSDGFYLSEDFHSASVWRRASWAGYQAIIVYKIDKHLLDANQQNGLDLTNNKAEWQEVVLCCRNGYVNKRIRKTLKDVTFIRGPMCLNPQDLSRERPSGFGRAHMQVCVRGEAYAENFGALDNIGCVLFY